MLHIDFLYAEEAKRTIEANLREDRRDREARRERIIEALFTLVTIGILGWTVYQW